MAWFVAGAAVVGFVGFANAVSPSRKESEEAALRMFDKDFKDCTRNERIAIDIAVGGPKLDNLRDKFQGLFAKPKGWSEGSQPFKFRGPVSDDEDEMAQRQLESSSQQQSRGYALYADSDVEAVYDVHQDTDQSGYEYEARWEDLKRLAPFDIDTEELKELGTYNIQEVLMTKAGKVPQVFTLPRQLGGATTSSNVLLNKLTDGARAGLPAGYVEPGMHVFDKNYPPTDNPVEEYPEELRGNPAAAADWEFNRWQNDGQAFYWPAEESPEPARVQEAPAATLSARPNFLSNMFKRKPAAAGTSSSEYEDEDETEEESSSS